MINKWFMKRSERSFINVTYIFVVYNSKKASTVNDSYQQLSHHDTRIHD